MPDLGGHEEEKTALDRRGPARGTKHPIDQGWAGAWAGPAFFSYSYSPSCPAFLPTAVLPHVRLADNQAPATPPEGDARVPG